MAKKKKGKVIALKPVQQSAENYIRNNARLLPIVECIINEDWESAGICNIVVARKHKNGNITAGLYLVDMFCLGLKDTFYEFNLLPADYELLKRKMPDWEACEYSLAHNIIYGGIAFAEEYGFKPHKDFEIARFILEEDTDDVEFIELDFGIDGIPNYVPGPNDSPHKIQAVISTLTKTAGAGNFKIADLDEDFDDIDDDWEDDEDEEDDVDEEDVESVVLEAVLQVFEKISIAYDDKLRTPRAKESLEEPFIGLGYRLSDDGAETAYVKFDTPEEEKEYYRLLDIALGDHNFELAIKGLRKAIVKYADAAPFYSLLQSALSYNNQYKESDKVAIQMYFRFPDYLPAKVCYANLLIDAGTPEGVLEVFDGTIDLNYLYRDRKVFHITEAANYYACMCRYFTAVDNIDSADMYMNAIIKNNLISVQPMVKLALTELCHAKMEKLGVLEG